jgi:hypothetical protein
MLSSPQQITYLFLTALTGLQGSDLFYKEPNLQAIANFFGLHEIIWHSLVFI